MRQDYPHLQFQRHWTIPPAAMYELGQCDAIVQAISDTPLLPEYHQRLLQVSLTKGAQATTAIEGNTLTEEEIRVVAAGESLDEPSKEYQEIEVRNILAAFNALLKDVAAENRTERITPELLRRFHAMIGRDLGAHFDAIPGEFRRDPRIVGPYRAPDHEDVPELVQRLCDWIAAEFHFERGQSFADAIVQAIVTHVYIEWIHPFGDGNGRTGRLVEFYVLLRAGQPDIVSHILSNFYNETRSEYYRRLDRANRERDLTPFVTYAVRGFRDGLLKTLRTIQANQLDITWRKLIHDRFAERPFTKKTVHNRRRHLALSLPLEGNLTEQQILALNPEIARSYSSLSSRTLQRDLQELAAMGIVTLVDGRYHPRTQQLKLQPPVRRSEGVRFGGQG